MLLFGSIKVKSKSFINTGSVSRGKMSDAGSLSKLLKNQYQNMIHSSITNNMSNTNVNEG